MTNNKKISNINKSILLKERVYSFLFQATVVLTLFNWVGMYIPDFLGVLLVNEDFASTYPAIVLTVLIFVENIKARKIARYKHLCFFFIIYFVVYTVITLHSIISFRFIENAVYDNLSGGPKYAFLFVRKLFPTVSDFTAFAVSFVIRTEINIIREFFFNWFVVYSIALYFIDYCNVQKYLMCGLYIAMGIVFFYSIFEIAYKMGFDWGRSFLEAVNPYLAPIGTIHGWYPPLLPDNRLRGVFSEGGFFAYWSCICLPFFFFEIAKGKLFNAIPIIILVSNLILTQSRSAIVLFVFCVALFFIFSLILKRNNKNLLFLVFILVGGIVIGLILVASDGIVDKKISQVEEEVIDVDKNKDLLTKGLDEYVNQTISSLVTVDGGSNSSRLGLFISRLKIWFEYPVVGVGSELAGYYISDQFEKYPYKSEENNLWMQTQKENGSLSNTYPGLDAYSQSLCFGGIVGFIVDIGPIVLILLLLLLLFFNYKRVGDIMGGALVATLLSSVATILLFGFSNNFNTVPLYYIVIGLSVGVLSKEREKSSHENKEERI